MKSACLLQVALAVSGLGWLGLPAPVALAAPVIERPVDELPILKGPADLPEIPLPRKTSVIGTLVHVHTEDGQPESGLFVRITATALPGQPGVPDPLAYEKFMGPITMKSLGAVLEPTASLHHGWPRGEKVQFVFSARPSPAELNPATMAMVLLMDSMLRDWEIEQNFAIFGSIQPDGVLGPVGGIPERLAGAGRAHVARVVVPEKNYPQVADFLLSQGIASFVGTQVFSAKNFNEAGVLALHQLDDQTKEAVTLYGSIQRTLLGAGANAVPLLRDERVQGTLQRVLAMAPNHLSAKVLYDWGTGQHTQISFDGSVDAIDRFAADLIRALHARLPDALATPRANVAADIGSLRFVRDRLDTRARGYADALLKFGDVLQRAQGTSTPPPKRIAGALQTEFDGVKKGASDEWAKMAAARMNSTPEKDSTSTQ